MKNSILFVISVALFVLNPLVMAQDTTSSAPYNAMSSGDTSSSATSNVPMKSMADARQALQGACKSDIQQFCKGITPGSHRLEACLKSHEDQLSTSCSTQWQQAKATLKQMHKQARQACSDDVKKFCSTASGTGIRSCLNDHMSDLSNSCQNFQKQHQMGGESYSDLKKD